MSVFSEQHVELEPNLCFDNDGWSYDNLFNPGHRLNLTSAYPDYDFLNAFTDNSRVMGHLQLNPSTSTTLIGNENVGFHQREESVKDCAARHESSPSTEMPSNSNDQKKFFKSAEGDVDSLFNVDNFSETSNDDMPTSTALYSSLNNLSAAIRNLMTEAGSISEAIGQHSSVIEAFTQKVQESSNAFSELHKKIAIISSKVEVIECSFDEKMDKVSKAVDGLAGSLHGKIDGLAEMVEQVVKCERLAMEKFGRLTKRMERPASHQPQTRAAVDLRRRSPPDQI